MDNITQNSLAYFLISSMPGLNKVVSHSQFLIVIVEPKALFDSALFLKNNQQLRFDSLLDVWCTDYISHDRRFEVNYLFLSTTNAMRIVVRTTVSEFG